jgi:sugar phosphate isomerase/epimerase
MAKLPVGLQLFSVRKECEKDFEHVIREVARMGYEGVEFAGYHGKSAEELRSMLDDAGLKCCGTHLKIGTLLGDELEKTVEFNQVLGNKYLIVAALEKEYHGTADDWKRTAGLFNEIAERLKPYGMMTGYHNHHQEFLPMEGAPEGTRAWDLFFSNTTKDVVMQIDTGNAAVAGVDAAPFVERYPGRALTVHLKEWDGDRNSKLLGEGKVKWQDMFKLCETVGGTKWYIVEQLSDTLPPLECVEKCLQNLRGMGK